MARSRSPPATRFSKTSPPTLKAWVLCRVGANKWRDAVPALVSRVAAADQGSKKGGTGVTVSVLAPNVLALQHSFGGGAYKELSDLPLQDVRPYHGKDLQKLRDALLAAFRQQAKSRAASAGPPAEGDRDDWEEEVIPPADVPPPDMRLEAPAPDLTSISSACESTPVLAGGAPADQQAFKEPARRRESQLAVSEISAAAPVSEPEHPPTPEPCKPRSVGAPITPECPVLAQPARPAAVPRDEKVDVGAVLSKQRLRALTAVVAKAFQAASETTLTREELRAHACASEAKASAAELDEALDRLNSSGKIFLSSDLVFLL